MRKTIVFLIFALYAASAWGQAVPFDSTKYYERLFADDTEFDIRKFEPLPSFGEVYNYNEWELIDAINPVAGYAYWECRYYRMGEEQLVVYNGDRKTYGDYALATKLPVLGFFVGCHPAICFSWIVAVREDRTVSLIDDEKKLIAFMGTVDNMEEVLLQIKARGYGYDEDTLIGGAYREESDRYLLYLLEYSEDPVTFNSIKAVLYKSGKFEVISKVTYKALDEYILH